MLQPLSSEERSVLDVTNAKARRQFYLERGLRKRPVGTGSNIAFLMALPRTVLPVTPEEIFEDIQFVVIGGVATRAYAPERATKDIDFLIESDRFAGAVEQLRKRGFTKSNDLFFPSTSLGLYGEAWTKDGLEIDIVSTKQQWCKDAFESRVEDQTGLRVIPLPYLVLMKFDSARGIDQGDLTRMLGPLDDGNIEKIIEVVVRYTNDAGAPDEIRQYAQLGRWEMQNGK